MKTARLQYIDIADKLRNSILAGELKPGERLCSIRNLAQTYQVGRQVVLSAFNLLSDENYLVCIQGSGTMVNPDLATDAPVKHFGLYLHDSFLGGFNTDLFESCCCRANQLGHDLVLASAAHPVDVVQWSRNLDGVLMSGFVNDELLRALRKVNKPTVVVGNYYLTEPTARLEVKTEEKLWPLLDAALQRVDNMRIGALIGTRGSRTFLEFMDCIAAWCDRNRQRFYPELILCCDESDGYEGSGKIMSAPPETRCNVLYTTSGTYQGFASYVFDHGIAPAACPVVVVQTRNIEKLSFRSLPLIVMQDEVSYGKEAIDLLLEEMNEISTGKVVTVTSGQKEIINLL